MTEADRVADRDQLPCLSGGRRFDREAEVLASAPQQAGIPDEAIPPDAERLFASRMGATTVEVASSHVAMVSHPDEVAQLIKTAAGG